jgi:hypothetical protein
MTFGAKVPKTSGLGDNLYVSGVDVSNDIGSLKQIGSPIKLLPMTGIDKAAYERVVGIRDGIIDFTSYFNPTVAHPVFSALPRTDVIVTYFRGTAIGNTGAAMVAKQLSYDPKRGGDGSLTCDIECKANAYGLEWGRQLTAGKRTDTTATNGSSFDQTTVSTSFGWQAYLQVFAVTGTSVTVTIQDSANDSAFTNLSGGAFTAATGITSQRLASGSTDTVRRYVRVVTSGTFSNAVFSVLFVRNLAAVAF